MEKKKCGDCYWHQDQCSRWHSHCHRLELTVKRSNDARACMNFITPEDYEKSQKIDSLSDTKLATIEYVKDLISVSTRQTANVTSAIYQTKAINREEQRRSFEDMFAQFKRFSINIVRQHRFVFTVGEDGIAKGFSCEPDENFVLHCYGKTAEESLGVAFETLHQGDQVIYEPETGLIKKLATPPDNFRGSV